jgi:UDP-2,3-diacylglucosamine hydrolase
LRSNSHIKYQSNARASYSENQRKTNVTLEACAATMRSHSSSRLIHGHTHLPAHHQEKLGNQAWQRWVLSDWDLDHPDGARPRASALLINEQGAHSIDLIKA